MKNFACLVVLVCVCGCGMSSQDYQDYKTALEIREYEQKEVNLLMSWPIENIQLDELGKHISRASWAKQKLEFGTSLHKQLPKEDRQALQEQVEEGKRSKEKLDTLTEQWMQNTVDQNKRLEIAKKRVREFRKRIK